jgi:beta-glucosidase
MRLNAIICLFTAALFTASVSAQTITGKIVDKRGKGIADATVALKVKGTVVKSDAAGTFKLSGTPVINSGSSLSPHRTPFIKGRDLLIYNEFPQMLKVELFAVNGKLAGSVFKRFFDIGSFSIPVSSLITSKSANGLYIVRVTKGDGIYTFPFSPICSIQSTSLSAASGKELLAKQLATADSLVVSKESYVTVTKGIDSDVAQDVGTITLNLVNDPDAAIEKKVDSLLALMTIDEKVAQTTEAVVTVISPNDLKTKAYGSSFNGGGCPFSSNAKNSWATNLDAYHDAAKQTRLGIPILYGIDAVHGLSTVEGATIFPQNIGMGCTGDTSLVAKMANVTAKECRAVGINLNFAPAISVVRNEKWGRSYEGYGETPEINSMMAAAYVRGLQGFGNLSSPEAVAACAKHYIGDGGTTDGVNGGITKLSDATMRAIHLPPYKAAVSEMVASIMPSYNAWDRAGTTIRCTNDKYSLTDLLKGELKFDGFCLSDWDAIPLAVSGSDAYTPDNVSKALNAGIDMAMVAPNYVDPATKKVNDYMSCLKSLVPGTVQQSRLDDAVKRILRIKFRMNLFAGAKSNPSLLSEFGSASHRAIARECVRKSLVLLKNDGNVLPLSASEKVVVVGPWANSLGAQCGGWTITWQGAVNSPTIVGTTILKGLQNAGGSNVTFDENGNNLSAADKIVLVIGEAPYAEGCGDNGRNTADCPACVEYPGKAVSIKLAECPHSDLLNKCFNSGKPVIVILISGRPLIITPEIAKAKAFVAAWLPGSEGDGVGEVLYKSNGATFTGKLTHTWPSSLEQIPINSGTAYADEPKGSGGTPLFEYGYGLTY